MRNVINKYSATRDALPSAIGHVLKRYSMTKVTSRANTIEQGIENMLAAMNADYAACWGKSRFYLPERVHVLTKPGRKYTRVVGDDHSVTAFIVTTSDDKKFKLGDILKPDSWLKPARNAARGNVLDGNYSIAWTGPLYLK
jgi:hypothetical protein